MTIPNFTSALGRELYYAVWRLVRDSFFDTKRLETWHLREHECDEEIVDEESTLRCIDKMLASLGDTYTERLATPPATSALMAANSSPENTSDTKAEPAPVMAVVRPDGFAYIRILNFDSAEIYEQVKAGAEKIADSKGVVLDLRLNSGGRMHEAMASCGLFLKDGLIATLETHEEPGMVVRQYALSETEFFANVKMPDGSEHSEKYERPAAILAGKPLVILISSRTASSAEMMTAALVQNGVEGKVCMVGSGETPGKGIAQAEFSFLEGKEVRIRVTRSRWFVPSGEWLGDCGQTERNGITPDVVVENDRGLEGVEAAFRELRRMLDFGNN